MSVDETRYNILSVAKVYLGYKEGYNNDNMFGDWYGMPRQPWCAMFASYCMDKAGVSQEIVKKFASCTAGWNWFSERGLTTRLSGFVPSKGDLIFFDWNPEKGDGIDHVGIVDRVENGRVYTVEGNHNDKVDQFDYPINSNQIWGYATPAFTGNEKIKNSALTNTDNVIEDSVITYPVIARGSSGEYVKKAQDLLILRGYLLSAYGADGIFGAETEAVVKNFQSCNNLIVDGIVGPQTWKKLYGVAVSSPSSYPGSVIGMGARGENVVKIQNELIRRGYNVPGGADGQFGSGCRAAVIQFQTDRNLDADGIVGKATWDALFPESSSTSSTYPGYVLDMGARGENVVAVQERLMSLGYDVPGGADGQFGSGLKNAIRQFQTDRGLEVDGSVGKNTWDALFPQSTTVSNYYPGQLISYGMSNYSVTLIQNRLSDLGYSVGAIDGIFGDDTRNAVILFQTNNNLTADGIVGELTWNKLFGNSSSNTGSGTINLATENQMTLDLLERLYSYAGEYKPKYDVSDKNRLVLQYLRGGTYNGKMWTMLAYEIDPNWINFVNSKEDINLENYYIYMSDSKKITLPHLAVSTEVQIAQLYNLIYNSEVYFNEDTIPIVNDLTSWSGDLLQFANIFSKSENKDDSPANYLGKKSEESGQSYGFGYEDLYQDLDAFSLYLPLIAKPIHDVFREYYVTKVNEGANRRFSNFILSRIVNDKLPDDISILDGNRAKLKGLSYQYLDKGFGETLPSEVALLFSIYKNYSYAEKYKESVSEAFTSLVISKAYLE